MKFSARLNITGMKASKGTLEDGTGYDLTKVYSLNELDSSRGNAKGMASAEYNFGNSEEFKKFEHLPFPFVADCELELVTNGRSQKTVLHSIKPVQMAKAA